MFQLLSGVKKQNLFHLRDQVCDGKVNCPFEDDEFDCREGECVGIWEIKTFFLRIKNPQKSDFGLIWVSIFVNIFIFHGIGNECKAASTKFCKSLQKKIMHICVLFREI